MYNTGTSKHSRGLPNLAMSPDGPPPECVPSRLGSPPKGGGEELTASIASSPEGNHSTGKQRKGGHSVRRRD
jgi:hypothetical protein